MNTLVASCSDSQIRCIDLRNFRQGYSVMATITNITNPPVQNRRSSVAISSSMHGKLNILLIES